MIGIICAMDKEVVHLLDVLEAAKEETIGSLHFHIGTLAGQEVVIARCGIGKVNAAICAQTMCLTYQPTLVINTGVAGALDPALEVYDAVIATALVEHDMDTTPFGDPAGLINVGDENLVEIPVEKSIYQAMRTVAQAVGLHAECGVVASGDQFISSYEQKQRIRSLFGAIACEMEGAAIAHTCYMARVPFCVLRVISDSAAGKAEVEYSTFVGVAAAKSAEVIEMYLRAL